MFRKTIFRKTTQCLSTAVLTLAFAGLANATPVTDINGNLLGATNVDVLGTLYDVTFVDDTCINAFNGCTAVSDFTFMTAADAGAAAQALLDQVLMGVFDDTPGLTLGCQNIALCEVWTPYNWRPFQNTFVIDAFAAHNYSALFESGGFLDITAIRGTNDDFDFATSDTAVWAVWSTAGGPQPLPEPGSLTLISFGLIGMVIVGRRRRSS